MGYKEICENVGWIHQAHERFQWHIVYTVMTQFSSTDGWKFTEQNLSEVSCSIPHCHTHPELRLSAEILNSLPPPLLLFVVSEVVSHSSPVQLPATSPMDWITWENLMSLSNVCTFS